MKRLLSKNKLLKIVAIIMTFVLAINSFTDTKVNFAQDDHTADRTCREQEYDAVAAQSSADRTQVEAEKEEEPYILGENISGRTEDSRAFDMSDGTILVEHYLEPVHYKDEKTGCFKDIDNTLTEVLTESGKAVYKNTAGVADIAFAKNPATSGDVLSLSIGGYSVGFSMVAKNATDNSDEINVDDVCELSPVSYGGTDEISLIEKAVSASAKAAAVTTLQVATKKADAAFDYSAEKRTAPVPFSSGISAVKYESYHDGVDLEYELSNTELKENIVVKKPAESYEYRFAISADGLTLYLLEDGSIEALGNSTDPIFTIPAPFMTDAVGEYSGAVIYALSGGSGEYILDITADADWINETERAFPIKIDPIINFPGSLSSAIVFSNGAASVTNNGGYGYAGRSRNPYESVPYYKTYISYNLSAYNTAEYTPLGAAFYYQREYQAPWLNTVGHDTYITSPVAVSTALTYATAPSNLTRIVSESVTVVFGAKELKSSNIPLDYITDEDYLTIGFLPMSDLNTNRHVEIALTGTDKPVLTLKYKKMMGLDEDYVTERFDADGISSHVNVLSGGLTTNIDLMTVNNNILPINISLVYNTGWSSMASTNGLNTHSSSTNGVFGKNMKLNLEQYIVQLDPTHKISDSAYVHYDADGSTNIFKSFSEGENFKCGENGLYYTNFYDQICSTVPSTSYNEGALLRFTDGRLTEIVQGDNRLIIGYSSNKISNVNFVVNNTTLQYVNFAYNANNFLTQLTSNYGDITTIGYDSNNRVTSVTGIDGTKSFTYDTSHRLKTVKDIYNFGHEFVYSGNKITQVISKFDTTYTDKTVFATGQNATMTYYPSYFGTSESSNSYTFSSSGKCTAISQTDLLTNETTSVNLYYNNTYKHSYAISPGNAEERHYKHIYSDYYKYIDRSYIAGMLVKEITTEVGFDGKMRSEIVSEKIGTAAIATISTTTYDYTATTATSTTVNADGTFTSTTVNTSLSDGKTKAVTTNKRGSTILNTTMTITDKYGYVIMQKDAAGARTYYNYASMADNYRLIASAECEHDSDYDAYHSVSIHSGYGHKTLTYTYTSDGKLYCKSDGLHSNTYSYDNGAVYGDNAAIYNFSLDGSGRLGGIKQKFIQRIGYTYDSQNRLSIVNYANNQTANYTYSANGLTETVTYKNNMITTDTYSAEYTPYSSYANGLTVYNNGVEHYSIAQRYDYTKKTYANADTAVFWDNYTFGTLVSSYHTLSGYTANYSYAYDAAGRLTTINNGTAKTGLTYNADGRPYTYELFNGTTSVIMQVALYSSSGRLDRWLDAKNAANTRIFNYDQVGNIASETNPINVTMRSYTYDSSNRLKTVTLGGVTEVYNYDSYGNISSVTGGTYETYSYTMPSNLVPRLVSWQKGNTEKTFTYDAMGNPTTYKSSAMTWTQGTRLKSYLGAQYAYGMDGMRRSKSVGGVTTNYYYDNMGRLAAEYRGGVLVYYYYDTTGIAGMRYGNSYYYFKKDAMGDIIEVVNGSGTVVGKYAYDAWGNHTIVTDTNGIATANPFRYRGYYYDTESGFYYLQTRYYDPEIRRFVSQDNLELVPQLSQVIGQLNLYTYCNNNPVMHTDPTGESLVAIIVGIIIGAASGALNAYLSGATTAAQWAISIGIGALLGGLGGYSQIGGLAYGILVGGYNAVSDAYMQYSQTGSINIWQSLTVGLISGLFAGLLKGASDIISKGVTDLSKGTQIGIDILVGGYLGGIYNAATTLTTFGFSCLHDNSKRNDIKKFYIVGETYQ